MVQNVQKVQAVQVVSPHPDLPRGGVRKRILCPPLRGTLKRGGSPVSHSVACRRKDRHRPTKCNAELKRNGLNGLNDWNVLNKRAVPVP